MLQKGFIKPSLSVSTISCQAFLLGIGAGLFTALVLSLFFNYGRELMRYFFTVYYDLVDISPERRQLYNIFYAALSLSLGSNLMLWLWSKGIRKENRRASPHLRLTGTYAFFIVWMLLEVFINFLFPTSFGHYGYWGERTPIIITGVQSSIIYLLPLVIFMHGWHSLRLAARGFRWMLASIALIIILSPMLAYMTTPDPGVIDELHQKRYREEYQFIDSILWVSQSDYGVTFSPEEEKVLRQFSTISAHEQLARVRVAFASPEPVSLREILILRISFHNLRLINTYEMYGTWPFPLPSELYRQLRQFDLRSPEAVEILMTIKELVHLYNVTYDFPHEFGQRKARKLSFYMRFFLRQKAIADDLKAVVRKINADEELTDMYGNMPVPDQKSARLRH